MKNEPVIDRVGKWVLDRYARLRTGWKIANLDSEDRNLIYQYLTSNSGELRESWDADDLRRIAVTTSWIYACATLIGDEFSNAKLEVKQIQGESPISVTNHPLEKLLRNPNPHVDLNFMWKYAMWWMQLRGNAYWFLAPQMGSAKTIAEIWPVPADKIMPIPGTTEPITGYAYKLNNGQMRVIKPEYIVHFQYPNPFSLIDGLAPLLAAQLALETEQGTSSYQRDTYVTGRGVPHSIISLSEDLGDRDFMMIQNQIREDFEKERKVIIARSGDLKVTTVGLSQKEMDLVGQRKFTKDELATIFLGVPLLGATSGEEYQALHKIFVDGKIYALHRMIAGQLTLQLVQPYYGEQYVAEFEDVRAQDRALNVQERNVYWRAATFNEARTELKKPAFKNPKLDGLGELPLSLATDPQFVLAFFGLGQDLRPDPEGQNKPTRKKPVPNAALSESDAPVNQLSDAAEGRKMIAAPVETEVFSNAEVEGHATELSRWKKVALKVVKKGENAGLHTFQSDVLPKDVFWQVRGELLSAKTEEAVKTLFETVRSDVKAKAARRRTKDIRATSAYEADLISEWLEWSEQTADALAKAESQEERESLLEEALAALLLLLLLLGRRYIPQAVDLAYEGTDLHPSPEALQFMVNALLSNEKFLSESLIPDIRAKLARAYDDPDIQLALVSGEGAVALRGTLATLTARVGSYSGAYFSVYQYSRGLIAGENGKQIRWNLDPSISNHCRTCLEFGDKTYDSFAAMLTATNQISPSNGTECMSRCRCFLTEVD